jgi:chemotaxis protein methyltransferase CheR
MELTVAESRPIRELIKERSGIWLADSKTVFLALRLAPRLKSTNMDTVRDYFFYLKYDANGEKELDHLVDAVTVNETYFFRENTQFDDFCSVVVPSLMEQNKGRPLSIWSAGCSSGEEPYTIAMRLLEMQIDPGLINVIGTDINRHILDAAREGRYDSYSVRHVPPLYLLKYFDKIADGRYSVKKQVKQLVKFAHVNFMDPFSTGRMRDIGCVFCRNVIIYFDEKDKGRCIDNLRRSLIKGGYLFLGHSETLSHSSSLFDVVRLKQTIAYRNG